MMDMEMIILREVSQTEKYKHDITSGILKRIEMNLFTK